MIPDDALAGLDEFALLSENTAQAGVSSALPSVVRIERGPISALRWGSDPARVVFLHGGGQNAHTWDTVILGLGLPALAIDLPGHGRSAWRPAFSRRSWSVTPGTRCRATSRWRWWRSCDRC